MTFNVFVDGDPIAGSTMMENFRYANYGNHMIPYNSTGVGVSSTLDVGSSAYPWRNVYANNFNITGVFSVANQPTLVLTGGSGNFNQNYVPFLNYTTTKNVGGFTYSTSTGAITPPSAGTYEISFHLDTVSSDGSRSVFVRASVYTASTNTFLYTSIISLWIFSNTTATDYRLQNPHTKLRVDSGEYIKLEFAQSGSGGVGAATGVTCIVTKIF